MKITTKQVGEITVLTLSGRITIGEGDLELRNSIREELDKGALKVVFDFKDVTRIDSSGIGELVSAYTIISNRGGKLKLCNLPNRVIEILQVTQLLRIFEIYNDEEEAINSFE